jgi:acetyl/propionyl-CoA carboxylase alpha subunit/acetyl-CoA carboxylase carboxyltransferase component
MTTSNERTGAGRAIERVAIVNRGEAAVRFIRALRDYNRERGTTIESVALWTDTDRGAPFIRLADHAHPLGPALRPGPTGLISAYTDLPHVLAAIESTRCDAVWPGWGFVSENAEFVTLLEARGITFIGPSSRAMRMLGDKIAAKSIASSANVPMADWHIIAPDEPFDTTTAAAARIGYPLVVKASSGGGGRGIRVVNEPAGLEPAKNAVADEVRRSFGHGGLFLEACVTAARHIEVQLVVGSDGVGRAVGIRDCSLQRRHQKVLEEAPSPVVSGPLAETLQAAAVRLGEAVGYRGVGTVEFLVDPRRAFAHFLEVNTRLQVEHTVTELVTGLDLVHVQLDIAQGLPWDPGAHPPGGHAIEVRLNAEDPERGFVPSPGIIRVFRPPLGPGIRIDAGVAEGVRIAPEFDSMIAKVIAHGRDRRQALARLHRALTELELVVEDGASNKAFLLDLLTDPAVVDASADTGWLDRRSSPEALAEGAFEALCTAAIALRRQAVAQAIGGFLEDVQTGVPWPLRLAARDGLEFAIRGESHAFEAHVLGPDRYLVGPSGQLFEVAFEARGLGGAALTFAKPAKRVDVLYAQGRGGFVIDVDGRSHRVELASGGRVVAPAPALVVALHVAEGAVVAVGDRLATLEAMKMEVPVLCREAGRIGAILCRVHEQVQVGQPLFRFDSGHRTSRPEAADLREPAEVADLDTLLDRARSHLLGWEVPTPDLEAFTQRLADPSPELAEPLRARRLAELVGCFADLEQCFEQQLDGHELPGPMRAEALFHSACRSSRAGIAPTHPAFDVALQRALRHYGATTEPSPVLDEALYRMTLAHAEGLRQDLVNAVLRALIALHTRGLRLDDQRELELWLARTAEVARADKPMLRDNARQARYLLFRRERQSTLPETPRPAELLARLFAPESSKSEHLENQKISKIELLEDRLEWSDYLTATYGEDCAIRHLPANGLLCNAVHGEVVALVALVPHLAPSVLNGLAEALASMAPSPFELHLVLGHGPMPEDTAPLACLPARPPTLTRVALTGLERTSLTHRNFLHTPDALTEEFFLRDVHPERARRLELSRLEGFDIARLPTGDPLSEAASRLLAFRIQARSNPRDERIVVFGELARAPRLGDEPITRTLRRDQTDLQAQRELDFLFAECLRVIREAQAQRRSNERYFLNRVILHIQQPVEVRPEGLLAIARRLEGPTRGHGLQKVVVRARAFRDGALTSRVFSFATRGRHRLEVREDDPSSSPIRPATDYQIRVERARRLGQVYPYETLRALLGTAGADAAAAPHPDLARPGAKFIEYDIENGIFTPVERPPGENRAGVVVGILSHPTRKFPEGMRRVFIASDPTMAMGALAEPECQRILMAIDLAEAHRIPIEWLPVSSGAKIAMDSGTENLDWTARVLRRLVAFTQSGGEVNLIVAGVNVGAQSYWNAEATMLMHTRGILIQTPEGSMVLTGKKALEVSGSVAAEDERGIGGFERIMGRNGEAQVFARNVGDAYRILFDHYDVTYVAPGEAGPRRASTTDPHNRSILESPYEDPEGPPTTLESLFSEVTNPGRKRPFSIREVMRATRDSDATHLERFAAMEGAETAVIWDTHIGGRPVGLIGIESRNLPRRDKAPLDGPERWSGGTLFPQSSKKVARALNQASGNRPVVVLANLSGFDGSPESMRKLQLEYGAEIGRAVVNFKGPIVFVVIGRYHGGAYVVFSKALNPQLTALALEGSYASVIGGAPAAAVVFPREVRARAAKDENVRGIRAELERAESREIREGLEAKLEEAHSEAILRHQAELAREFDAIHSVERAVRVGSLDAVIPAARLRPAIIEALSRS